MQRLPGHHPGRRTHPHHRRRRARPAVLHTLPRVGRRNSTRRRAAIRRTNHGGSRGVRHRQPSSLKAATQAGGHRIAGSRPSASLVVPKSSPLRGIAPRQDASQPIDACPCCAAEKAPRKASNPSSQLRPPEPHFNPTNPPPSSAIRAIRCASAPPRQKAIAPRARGPAPDAAAPQRPAKPRAQGKGARGFAVTGLASGAHKRGGRSPRTPCKKKVLRCAAGQPPAKGAGSRPALRSAFCGPSPAPSGAGARPGRRLHFRASREQAPSAPRRRCG